MLVSYSLVSLAGEGSRPLPIRKKRKNYGSISSGSAGSAASKKTLVAVSAGSAASKKTLVAVSPSGMTLAREIASNKFNELAYYSLRNSIKQLRLYCMNKGLIRVMY